MELNGYEAVRYALANNLPLELRSGDNECPADQASSLEQSQIQEAFIFVQSYAETVGHSLNSLSPLVGKLENVDHTVLVDACITDRMLDGMIKNVRLASDDCFTHGDTISMNDGTVLVYRTDPKPYWYTTTNNGFIVAKDPDSMMMLL